MFVFSCRQLANATRLERDILVGEIDADKSH
jgi:hypothetical protein